MHGALNKAFQSVNSDIFLFLHKKKCVLVLIMKVSYWDADETLPMSVPISNVTKNIMKNVIIILLSSGLDAFNKKISPRFPD